MKRLCVVGIILNFIFIYPTFIFAQGLSDETREQQEYKQEQHLEDLEKLKEIQTTPKTAEEVLEMLKARAKEKIEERRKKELLKTKISAGVTSGYETNPANTQDILEKGDSWWEDTFSFNWLPKLNSALSADLGYSLAFKYYFEQEGLGTENHSFNGSFKYLPLDSGKLTVEPGFRQEWNVYPYDDASSYEQSKAFTKFSYYLNQLWSYGGKYEYAYKIYDKKAALNDSGANFDFHRADYRNTAELWLKRQIGKYSLKLRGKSYHNNSNSQYQHYDDYDSHDGEISLSGAFMKDSRLYVILTSDFEVKHYKLRQADDPVARNDRALQHRLNTYYTLNKTATLSYSFSLKNNNSNKNSGEFIDVTNSLGCTLNF